MGKRRHSEESREESEEDESENQRELKLITKGVRFSHVTIFHFPRKQGFVSVPSSGGSSLGMAKTHVYVEKVQLDRSIKATEDDEIVERGHAANEIEDCERNGFAPIPQKSRRSMLKTSGVKRIVKKEETDCKKLRLSRVFCGCRCGNICYPETCECILNDINCQSDFGRFPCSCLPNGCQNSNGRRQYNLREVKKHYFETLARVDKPQAADVAENSQYLHTH